MTNVDEKDASPPPGLAAEQDEYDDASSYLKNDDYYSSSAKDYLLYEMNRHHATSNDELIEMAMVNATGNSNGEYVGVKKIDFVLDHRYEPPANHQQALTQFEELIRPAIANLKQQQQHLMAATAAASSPSRKSSLQRQKEEEARYEYFKSNPLRNYAPTKGQTLLPQTFLVNLKKTHVNNSISYMSSTTTNKKVLPKIYSELRVNNNDVEQDREKYKQKLKTSLKLNLNSIDPQRNPIDLIESSKKIYSEYCKYNLTKPIDLSSIESVLKQKIRHKNIKQHKQMLGDDKYDTASSSNLSYKQQKSKKMKKIVIKKANPLDKSLLVDAQTVSIKNLDEINTEIKKRKQTLAKLDQYTTNVFQNFYTISNSYLNDYLNVNNNNNTKYEQNKMHHNPPTISKHTSTKSKQKQMTHSEKVLKKIINTTIDEIKNDHSVDSNVQQPIVQDNSANAAVVVLPTSMLPPASISFSDNNQSIQSSDERHKQKVKHAREKILNDQVERTNLNKMTILNPFEDTKILINIDKAPAKLLNSLLNKQSIAPRYIIPPMRANAYFKKVIPPSSNQQQEAQQQECHHENMSTPQPPPPIFEKYPTILSMVSTPPSHLDHDKQNSIKFESLKSLNEEYRNAFVSSSHLRNNNGNNFIYSHSGGGLFNSSNNQSNNDPFNFRNNNYNQFNSHSLKNFHLNKTNHNTNNYTGNNDSFNSHSLSSFHNINRLGQLNNNNNRFSHLFEDQQQHQQHQTQQHQDLRRPVVHPNDSKVIKTK